MPDGDVLRIAPGPLDDLGVTTILAGRPFEVTDNPRPTRLQLDERRVVAVVEGLESQLTIGVRRIYELLTSQGIEDSQHSPAQRGAGAVDVVDRSGFVRFTAHADREQVRDELVGGCQSLLLRRWRVGGVGGVVLLLAQLLAA